MSATEILFFAVVIVLFVGIVVRLAQWAARGSTTRVLLGLIVAAIIATPMFGIPIYAVTVLLARRRARVT